jgi:hypothetical protein
MEQQGHKAKKRQNDSQQDHKGHKAGFSLFVFPAWL